MNIPDKYIRFAVVSLLGFMSGLPMMLFGSTLQAWGTDKNLNLMTLGLLTLIGYPYAFKFLWAPFLDRYQIPLFNGLRRGWILTLGVLLASCILFLSVTQLPHDLIWFVSFAMLGSIFSATLDIAIDAYRIEYLSQLDYGLGNAYYVSAYRIAMLISGGLGLILASYLGWHWMYCLMAVIILLCVALVYFCPEPSSSNTHHIPRKWQESLILPIKDLLSRPNIILILSFILLYKLGEGLGTALISTFLLRYMHFSLVVVGGVYKTVGFGCTVLGAFIGGYIYRKLNMYQSLILFGILQAVGLLFFAWLSMLSAHLPVMVLSVGIEALTAGMATTVFVAFLMRLCNTDFTATQFAILSALPACARVFTGPLASFIVEHSNWTTFFVISFLVCWPSLILIRMIKSTIIAIK